MKWKQTGKGGELHRYDLPLLESLRVLDLDDVTITVVADGDFDGYVYTCDAGGTTLRWWRYPAELVSDEKPVAADYADSAE